MLDLNDVRIFESVATRSSFSDAARDLHLPKSSVSRAIARLEAHLHSRLFQRTTREVVLTDAGRALLDRCAGLLAQVDEAVGYVRDLTAKPRGLLRVSAGIGFGLNVLSKSLPDFLARYPEIDLSLDLTNKLADLISESVDVAIRMGPMPDSQLVTRKLGTIRQYLCAAPAYLERSGTPETIGELAGHDLVELPGPDGRPRPWEFSDRESRTKTIEVGPRLGVNDMLTLHRLVVNGAGVGCISGYLCAPDLVAGRLVHLFPEWRLPEIEVSVVFPSHRELSPAVRALVDFLKATSIPGRLWQDDPLADQAS